MGDNFIIAAIANFIGVPYDQILLVLTMMSAMPLSIINHFLTNPKVRLWYGLITGIILQYFLYGSGIAHTGISSIVSYLFIKFFGRKLDAIFVFLFTFFYLSGMHLYRLFYHYGEWSADDPTSIYMLIICKFSFLAYAYQDGAQQDKDIKCSHWREYKLTEKPTLLETFSYVYYFPSACIGPSFEFKDFKDFIYLRGRYAKMPYDLILPWGIFYFFYSFFWMGFYGYFGPRYPLSYCGTVEFGEKSMWYKFWYINFAMAFHRAKFYSGWVLAFTSMIISGLAYSEIPRDKADPQILTKINGPYYRTFEKGSYGDIIDCEFGINPKTKITSWNHSVHLWLKYCFFLRVINLDIPLVKNNKSLASGLTFILSAFWHGFYPTYYITFIFFFLWSNGNEEFDKLGFYEWIRKKPLIFRTPVWLFSQFMCNALGTIIFNLDYNLFIQYLKNTNAIGIVLSVSIFIIGILIRMSKGGKKKGDKPKLKSN
ncbi:MAG: hypothetical protein MJ252_17545 [archaeon]|nr:hypothetical protein [archaeon]